MQLHPADWIAVLNILATAAAIVSAPVMFCGYHIDCKEEAIGIEVGAVVSGARR
jgi:hypothetical protein